MILIPLLLLSLCVAENVSYQRHTLAMALMLSGYLGYLIARKVTIPVGLLFFWSMVSGLFVYLYPGEKYGFYGVDGIIAFSNMAQYTLITILLVSFAVFSAPMNLLSKFKTELGWFCIAQSIVMIFNHGKAMLANQSMDSSLVAILLPMVLFAPTFKYGVLGWIPILAILLSGSVNGVVALFVCLFTYLRSFRHRLIAIALSVAALPFIPLKHSILESDGRTEIWVAAYKYFENFGYWWTGLGTGTYGQHERLFYNTIFWWLHNDFFQITFDNGLIGGILALVIFFQAVWQSRKTPWLFSSIVTYGFTMLGSMPLRHTLSAVYAAVLIRSVKERVET